jgi:hypothetical protein
MQLCASLEAQSCSPKLGNISQLRVGTDIAQSCNIGEELKTGGHNSFYVTWQPFEYLNLPVE